MAQQNEIDYESIRKELRKKQSTPDMAYTGWIPLICSAAEAMESLISNNKMLKIKVKHLLAQMRGEDSKTSRENKKLQVKISELEHDLHEAENAVCRYCGYIPCQENKCGWYQERQRKIMLKTDIDFLRKG